MSKWIPVWSYVPIDYHQEAGILEHITQKAVFLTTQQERLSASGSRTGTARRR